MSRRRGMLGGADADTSRESIASKAMGPAKPHAASVLELAKSGVNPFRRPKAAGRPSTIDYAKR
jgi:hypothetical protein